MESLQNQAVCIRIADLS